MNIVLRRHETATDDRYLVLKNGKNLYLMPKFDNLMMDNKLVMVDIPKDYYDINAEAIDAMASETINYINELEL
jgi:predicted protein tyrosine phosphatase